MADDARRARDQRRRADLLAGLRLETRLQQQNPPSPAQAEQERQRRYDRIARILEDVDAGVPDASYIDAETAMRLRAELVRLERAAAPSDVPVTPLIAVGRSNTILYCRHWQPTVRFYRDDLGLPVLAENEWYVEFRVTTASSLSLADSANATIDDVDGQGITLSWHVTDLTATRERLVDHDLAPSEIRNVGDAVAFYLIDPEGHRLEVWSDAE